MALQEIEDRLRGLEHDPGELRLPPEGESPSPVLVAIAAHRDRVLLAALADTVRLLAGEVDQLREELRSG